MSSVDHPLKLYWAPGACSLAIHILLRNSGLPFNLELASRPDLVPKDEYVKLNPKKQVPILELEPGVILTEVPALIYTISELVPEKKYLGETRQEISRSLEMFSFLSGSVHAKRFAIYFRPERFVDGEDQIAVLRKHTKEGIRESFAVIEEKIKDLKPAREEEYRAFDGYLFVMFRWANMIGIHMDEFPKFKSRMLDVSEFKIVKDAVEVEGISLLGTA